MGVKRLKKKEIFIILGWLTAMIGLCVTFECSLTKYCSILIFICEDKNKHFTSNLDTINNDIASNKILI